MCDGGLTTRRMYEKGHQTVLLLKGRHETSRIELIMGKLKKHALSIVEGGVSGVLGPFLRPTQDRTVDGA